MNKTKKEPLVVIQPTIELLRHILRFTLLVLIFICSLGFLIKFLTREHVMAIELGVVNIILQLWYLIERSNK